jgi:1,4-dihydroxy-2-naphthoyl-CoA hydrolase
MPDLVALQAILAPLLPGLLGIELREATPERVVGALRVRPDVCTTGDSLHGGAFMAFADTLGAVGTVLNLPPGARTVTTDSSTKFLRGAPVGTTVIGTATPFHRGRTTQVWQTLVTTQDGKLCAVVTQTQLVISGGKDAARG